MSNPHKFMIALKNAILAAGSTQTEFAARVAVVHQYPAYTTMCKLFCGAYALQFKQFVALSEAAKKAGISVDYSAEDYYANALEELQSGPFQHS